MWSKHRMSWRVGMVALLFLGLAAGAKERRAKEKEVPTTAPATQARGPVDPKVAAEAVKGAIDRLVKEVQDHQKDPKAPLRSKCNYFKENPTPDATVDAIVAAVTRTQGHDGLSDSYVKWQLLSGIATKVEPKQAVPLLQAYRNAATPFTRPGLDRADKRELDQMSQGISKPDAAKLNAKLQKQVEMWEKANEPLVEFRDEAYSRLPPSGDAILAGLDDAMIRAGHGVDADKHLKDVLAHAQTWAVTGTPVQANAIAGAERMMLDRLNGVSGRSDASGAAALRELAAVWTGDAYLLKPPGQGPPPKPAFPPSFYVSLEWDDKAKHFAWREGTARFMDAKRLTTYCEQMEETAAVLQQTTKR
jgi:hypothetical protein